jgi:hypothetical protein
VMLPPLVFPVVIYIVCMDVSVCVCVCVWVCIVACELVRVYAINIYLVLSKGLQTLKSYFVMNFSKEMSDNLWH